MERDQKKTNAATGDNYLNLKKLFFIGLFVYKKLLDLSTLHR